MTDTSETIATPPPADTPTVEAPVNVVNPTVTEEPAPVDPPTPEPVETEPVAPSSEDGSLTTESTPEPTDIVATPVDMPVIQPQDSYHDTASLQEAQRANLPTMSGAPLNPYAKDIITGLRDAVEGVKSWLTHIEGEIAKVEAMQQ